MTDVNKFMITGNKFWTHITGQPHNLTDYTNDTVLLFVGLHKVKCLYV